MSLGAIAERVQKGDPDRYLATMAVPPALRSDFLTLYALNLEAARAPWASKETMICEMRLQWWRDMIAADSPCAHEVAGPAHALIQRRGLPVTMMDEMIGARIWDIYSDPFEDQAGFDHYIDQTSGHLMWLAALICGADARAEAAVRDFAYASGLANYLLALPELEARGRRPLVDGRAAAVQELARAGLARLRAARAGRGQIGAASLALLPGWQAGALLEQVVADPLRVAEGTLGMSEFRRRGTLAWAALSGRF